MKFTTEIFYVLFAEILIVVPSTVHIILSTYITSDMRIPLYILSGIFPCIDTYFLLSTAIRNPGRLPKNYTSYDVPTVIEIKGQTFTMYPCTTCKVTKDLRTHHCKICDYCVDRLDHHCPWVANCIGRRNHRQFILLLIFSFLHCFYLFTVNLIELIALQPPPGHYGGEIIIIIISLVLGWSLGSLLSYQLFLIINNQTTHENRRKLFKSNPFYISVWLNCYSFWKMKKEEFKQVSNDNKC
jgi:DHHC palmitoyltransferase